MRIIFIIIVFFFFSNLIFAAFPVLESNNPLSITSEIPIEGKDIVATISMICAGIAVFFSIALLTSSGLGWGALFLIMLTAIFYLLAFIFGLLGLRSKSKKWHAFIGFFSGLLVLLVLAVSAGSTGDPAAKD